MPPPRADDWNTLLWTLADRTREKNRAALWERLDIDVNDITLENPYWQMATSKTRGCQIDYMIQCRNYIVYVCEIKLSRGPLPKTVIGEVEKKDRPARQAEKPHVQAGAHSCLAWKTRSRMHAISTTWLTSARL